MFKRVLVVLLLVAVLVVPGSASSFYEDFSRGFPSSWSEVYSARSYRTVIDGQLWLCTNATSIGEHQYRYAYPDGVTVDLRDDVLTFVAGGAGGSSRLIGFLGISDSPSSLSFSSRPTHCFYLDSHSSVGVYQSGSLVYTYPVDCFVSREYRMWVDDSNRLVTQVGDFEPVTHGVVTSFVGTPVVGVARSNSEKGYFLQVDSVCFGDAPPASYVPCTIYVYDSETRLPLSGAWSYYIVIQDAEPVSGSAYGPSTVVYLPETSILEPHLIRVTKEGYEQAAPLMFDVPAGGRDIHVYLSPLEMVAPDGSSVVTFVVTDIETGTPVRNCLVNVDGIGKFAGPSGIVLFVLPENSEHQWVVTADGYWPIGGNFTLGADDLTIPVEMTKKTSDLPRPPLPDLPNFPVIPPSLDPASFRTLILSVPYLGDMAEPFLDVIDSIAAGVDDIASSVLDFLTAPADLIVRAVEGISSQLVSVSKAFLDAAAIVLDSLGMLIAAIPTKVINLVTFAMILDIIILLLRGGL